MDPMFSLTLDKPKENRCFYRHPDPGHGEPRVSFAPLVPFPLDPLDPLDPLQNSVRLQKHCFYNDFGTFCRNWGPIFGPNH